MTDQLIPSTALLLQQPKPSDAIALYGYYYALAGGMTESIILVTTGRASREMQLSVKRVRRARKMLISLGLVNEGMLYSKSNGRAIGHYIVLKNLEEAACNPAESG